MNTTGSPSLDHPSSLSEPEPSSNFSDVHGISGVPIEYPYGIVGVVTASLAVVQFIIFVMARDTLYMAETDRRKKKETDATKSVEEDKDNVCTRWVHDPVKRTEVGLKIMLFLFWCLPIG